MNISVNDRMYPRPVNSTFTEENVLIMRRDYVAEIENLDHNFGEILDLIRAYGEFNNTIICASSDHGEMLGDYSLTGKQYPWSGSMSVPLACMGPGIVANQVIDWPVTNMDLAGTFLDYTESKIPENETDVITTKSLRDVLEGRKTHNRNYVLSGFNWAESGEMTNKGSWRAVIQRENTTTTTWKYLCCTLSCPGRDFSTQQSNWTYALFNLTDDLYEQNNLAGGKPMVVQRMKKLLPAGFCQDF